MTLSPLVTAARGSRWKVPVQSQPTVHDQDSIQAYFSEPVIPTALVQSYGGLLKYWHIIEGTTPSVARMVTDFCSGPASLVDAERAFSNGRRAVNFMQHNMSSATFRAQMAVGSWLGTPLFPSVQQAVGIIEKQMARDMA